jgi:cullin-associated NEDD8-dissociated protein 1
MGDIVQVLREFPQKLNKENSNDIDNEIVEACLSTYENLLKKCPREVRQHVNEILALAKTLISYDPNYTYNEDDGDKDMDDA